MNRNILFKAKQRFWKEDEDENCWAEGLYQHIGSRGNVEHYITENLMLKSGLQCFYTEIDPETLCQHTGEEYDSEGIWEHDIYSIERKSQHYDCTVEYFEGSFWFTPIRGCGEPMTLHDAFKNGFCCFKLGNKFDNPELLKGRNGNERD